MTTCHVFYNLLLCITKYQPRYNLKPDTMTQEDIYTINAVVVAVFFIVAMIKIQLLQDKCETLEKENKHLKANLEANRLTRRTIQSLKK